MRERDEWVRNTVAVRAAQVRSLLAGGPIEVNQVEPALGYRLRQHHLGIVAWVEEAARKEGTLVELERMAGRLADHLSKGARALFVSRDESSAFIWIPLGAEQVLRTDAFGGPPLAPDASVRLAVGEQAEGRKLRVTIREALRAHAVALMAGPVAPRVIRFARWLRSRCWPRTLAPRAPGWAGPSGRWPPTMTRPRGSGRHSRFPVHRGKYQETASGCHCTRTPSFYRVRKAQEVRGRKVAEDRSSSNWRCSPAIG